MKLSLCMVVRNAEKTIPKIFKATRKVVDEIVIMDQDSDDGTENVCNDWGAYYHQTTRKGLADIDRQSVYNIATGDMVLALDDDELPDKRLLSYIQGIKQSGPKYDVYWFKFKNLVDSIDIHSILGDDWHPRLWVRSDNAPPVITWPHTAHTFPTIPTPHQIFSTKGMIEHRRSLAKIRRVTEDRSRAIDPENQQREAQFLAQVEQLGAAKKGRAK